MLATVPMRCKSTGRGSSTSALRCITMPTGFCSLTALCAAITERGRARAIGSTVPGNSTMPRTGTMMCASGGNGGDCALCRFCSDEAPGAGSAIRALRLLQRDQQATVGGRSMNGAVASGGKIDTAFEAALRKLEAVDDRGLHLRRVRANPRNDQLPRVNKRLDLGEVDPGQRDQHEHRAV